MATRRGNGAGWWGPAKGAGSKAPKAAPFEPGNQAGVGANEAKSVGQIAHNTAKELVVSNAVKAAQVWIDVMNDKTQPGAVRVAAAAKVVEHAEGTPIARSVSIKSDEVSELSDAELAAALAALRKDVAAEQARARGDSAAEPAEAAGVPSLH